MWIYKITNIQNGKIYIGQTRSINLALRWREHKRHLRQNKHKNHHLQCAWNSYGEDAFNWDIVIQCHSIEELNSQEIYYIKLYNSTDRTIGYNLRSGGSTSSHSMETRKKLSKLHMGMKHTEESKRKMSIAHAGKILSKETRKKISENHSRHMLGKTHSEITKIKLSKSIKKITSDPNYRNPMQGKVHSDEARKKISLAGMGRKYSKETIQKRREKLIGRKCPKTKEQIEKQRESLKKKWADPVFKERMRIARSAQMTDAVKDKIRKTKALRKKLI